ncbi:twin-arginine translocase TatA/TatE family subunit [Schaalia sp. lx-260]|uniref:twin-arginine translocase TatA/TatE family subunit n=1 Tax=Schaalia sp. lx-260 TaxID=2899082 RepID=UPI001E41E4CC|nr:twin-arginine translocase TatA/TatE family subunit [Schaalia sp. lx-260]MCD4549796.1 twin-arginine translocase TatA/TatE family subunit [Schaalia sp. lx-260]
MRPIHFFILLLVALIIFGAQKLPDLAKSLGQSVKILKKELQDDEPSSDAPQVEKITSEAAPSVPPTETNPSPSESTH